jgi:hypothetical protein
MLVLGCVEVAVAQAQGAAEPVHVVYVAPPACPDAEAFFRDIVGRTPRARAAAPGEAGRTFHVAIARRRDRYMGELWVEEASAASRRREVEGTTCHEVASALGLIAALAVDPAAPVLPTASAGTPSTTPASGGGSRSGRGEAPASSLPTSSDEAALALPRGSATQLLFSTGAELEVVTLGSPVVALDLFADLEVGSPRGVWVPSFRVTASRSAVALVNARVGRATLRVTQGGLEICPLRWPLSASLALRPCAGASVGVLEAQGEGVDAVRDQRRFWLGTAALARLMWAPLAPLAMEAEAGVVAPLVRDTFVFEPDVVVYRAPPVAFLARMGLGVRFP